METNPKTSTGQIVWLWTAIVISVLVLIISVGAVIGTWVIRGVAIDLNNSVMDGVTRIAETGSGAIVRVQERVNEISTTVSEVQSAVDDVSQNVADKGVILTVLPPEKEENLVNSANQIRETAETITSSLAAAIELYQSINAIPFIDLPRPSDERLQEINTGVQEIESGVDQFTGEVQQFRDNASAEVDQLSQAAGAVKSRLQTTEGNLDQLHADVEQLQSSAQSFKVTFARITTIVAIISTLVFLWVIYGMVVLIQKSLQGLRT